jgi:hypothetical protein
MDARVKPGHDESEGQIVVLAPRYLHVLVAQHNADLLAYFTPLGQGCSRPRVSQTDTLLR